MVGLSRTIVVPERITGPGTPTPSVSVSFSIGGRIFRHSGSAGTGRCVPPPRFSIFFRATCKLRVQAVAVPRTCWTDKAFDIYNEDFWEAITKMAPSYKERHLSSCNNRQPIVILIQRADIFNQNRDSCSCPGGFLRRLPAVGVGTSCARSPAMIQAAHRCNAFPTLRVEAPFQSCEKALAIVSPS